MSGLLGSPSPVKAIESLILKANAPNTSAFGRYAGMVLKDAGGLSLASLMPQNPVQLVPPSAGHLARLVCAGTLDETSMRNLVNVENALNRLICIADAIEDAPFEHADVAPRTTISFITGPALQPGKPGYRSAHMELPPIKLTEQPTIDYFNEVDWRVFDYIAANGRAIFQNSMRPNLRQSVLGAYAPDGSDWDIRTRLASIMEGLELPLRFSYRFDCDASEQSITARITIPPKRALPNRIPGNPPAGNALEHARLVYGLRVACLVGAACFGAGKHIEQAMILAEDGDTRAPMLACSFTRDLFVRNVLLSIDSQAFSSPSLRFDPGEIVELIGKDSVDIVSDNPAFDKSSFLGTANAQRIQPWRDTRKLPEALVPIFHAERICDIDTTHYHGPHSSVIEDAKRDSQDSVIAAIAHLERVIDELQDFAHPPDDDASARPLYCDQPLSRATVSLLDDHLAVSVQAQDYLRHVDPRHISACGPRYFRAPSALFHAHMGLSDLYERLGDYKGAEAHADRCIDLAPTTAQAHFRKSDLLAQQDRYTEAVNILIGAIPLMVSDRDCSLLYYHLALLLWRLGKRAEASAVYAYTASLQGEYAEKALNTILGLRKRKDSPVIVFGSPLAAAREMVRMRIPVAPSDSARALVVKAAIGLTCANAPEAAAPYAAATAYYLRDDTVIAIACSSIRNGLGDA